MKRKQSVIAVTCLIAGIVGFGSVYATEKAAQKRTEQEITKQTVEQQTVEQQPIESQIDNQLTQDDAKTAEEKVEDSLESVSKLVEPKEESDNTLSVLDRRTNQQENLTEKTVQQENANTTVEAKVKSTHFVSEGLTWPLEGDVVLEYSMDKAIYFPTLDQYRCNPAVVISGAVNDKVYLIGPGTITDVSTNEETGLTVTEDLGDGYTAIYGQLKELNFKAGDTVEAGQVIGYVNEPTKYYSTEGSNLYFAMEKDDAPINPMTYFD